MPFFCRCNVVLLKPVLATLKRNRMVKHESNTSSTRIREDVYNSWCGAHWEANLTGGTQAFPVRKALQPPSYSPGLTLVMSMKAVRFFGAP